MRFPHSSMAALVVAACLVTPAVADVAFDADFESGQGVDFTQTGEDSYSFRLPRDRNGGDRMWFYFEVAGASGRTLTFELLDTDETSVSRHWNTAHPVYSADGGETWHHVDGPMSHEDDVFRFTHTLEADSVLFAHHFPYTFSLLEERLEGWSTHPDVEHRVIGESLQGRPIHYLQITEGEVGDPGEKHGFWVLARQHPGEVTASYSMEAFLDWTLSDDPEAQSLRRNAVLNVVPMVNPDGVALGHYRLNYAGVNLNRVWDGSADMETSPEVVPIVEMIAHWVEAGHRYDMFLDFHSISASYPHFAYHAAPGQEASLYHTPEAYHEDLSRYLHIINRHVPHFSPTAGQTTGDNQQLAYHRQRHQYGVLAMTPEGGYNLQNYGPTPDEPMTQEHHRSVGEGFAKALVEFFGLHGSPAIAFRSDFEAGNGTDFEQVDEDTYSFRIERDTNAGTRMWFQFEVSGAEGRTLNFRMLDASWSHWRTAHPVVSQDGGETWTHVEGPVVHDGDENTLTFTQTLESDAVLFAHHFPYSVTMVDEKVAEWAAHPDVRHVIAGETVQGRPMHFLRITEGGVGYPGDKLGIWVLARQHPHEVTAAYTMEAFMDFVLSDDPRARALRRETVINAVPLMNPDGVYVGNQRHNVEGVNLNRVWDGSADEETSPEVLAIEQLIEQWVQMGFSYDFFIDFHSISGANPHFAYHANRQSQPERYFDPPNYFNHVRRYLALVGEHSPYFHPTMGASGSRDQRLAYHRQREHYGVPALTPEAGYNRQNHGPTPDDFMTPEVHRSVGVGFAKALADYFELEIPEGAETEENALIAH